ncbi:competence protein CoiA family protein [Yeosuana marina]|uniref:competence protein CoiA family protein n=1 Tax=Yeosuana marina TaxID=1565536 RepID=UPI0030C81A61
MIPKLTFALHKKQLVNIDQVVSGLDCNCFCPNPNCNSKLIARKGNIKKHHFAHYETDECVGAFESALHLLAKEIIQTEKRIAIPEMEFYDSEYENATILLSEKKEVKAQSVDLEILQGDFQPDVVMNFGSKQLFIEIAVTHFVDDEKRKKITNSGISTIEIDLSSFMAGFEKQSLVEALIYSADNKKWIYNSKQNLLINNYLKTKKRELEEEEEYYKKIEEEKNSKRKKARLKGYRIIKTNDYYQIHCPKTVKEASNKFKSNAIIERLRKGDYWNGVIYGHIGNSRYVYIGKDKYEIFPSDKDFKLTEIEAKERRRLYGQLMRISSKANIECETCEKCEYFHEYIDHKEEIVCKFK